MESHSSIALLAPVPIGLLRQAGAVIDAKGKVAFGSRAWELFRSLDELRDGLPIDVFIYASKTDVLEKVVSWRGRYLGHVEGVDGKHPAGRRYRSRLAMEDGSGWWAVFWELDNLEQIPPISTADLRGYGVVSNYGSSFVPEGPIIIDHPWQGGVN